MESVPDLLDADVLSDKDLAGDIGMAPVDIRRFHLPPPKVHEQLPEHKVETGHVAAERLARMNSASAEHHEGYEELCLFIRKLKAGMHFMR